MSNLSRIIRMQFGGVDFSGEKWRTTLDAWDTDAAWGPANPGELAAACTAIGNTFNTSLWATLKTFNKASIDYSYCRISQQIGDTVLGATEQFRSAVAGAGGTTTLAGSSAIVASKLTAVSTRAGRGRSYLPLTAAVLESTSGQVADADVDSINTAYVGFLRAIAALNITLAGGTANYHPVVVSNWGSGSPVPRLIITTEMNSGVDRQVRRQRNAPSQHTSIIAV